jgi:hypothetical protein
MTKKQTVKHLSLAVIEEHARSIDARLKQGEAFKEIIGEFSHLIGESVFIPAAIIEKKITRNENLKLFVKPKNSTLDVFGEIPDRPEADKLNERKIRKGSTVSFTGRIISFGCASLCLTDCIFE